MTQKTEEELISRFNEIFEEISISFDGKVHTEWSILENGSILIGFDSPIKEGLSKLYYKICPSFWVRLKEMF